VLFLKKTTNDTSIWKIAKVFMFRYVMIMLVPVFIISIIYFSSLNVIEQYIIKTNISMLDKTRDILESRIAEISSIIKHIAWNNKINKFNKVTKPFEGVNTYRILETRSELYDYSLINNYILDYYVVYLNSGIVIGPKQTYFLEEFYDNFFNYEGIDYDEWLEEISKEYIRETLIPQRQAIFKQNPRMVLTYIKDLEAVSVNGQSKVIFLLNGDEIRNLLDGFDVSEHGYAYIADENSCLLSVFSTQSGEVPDFRELDINKPRGYHMQRLNGENMLITYVISPSNGWRYVVAQPYENVMEKVSNIKNIGIGVFSGTVVLGVIIAFLWSNRSGISLKRTFDLIPQSGKSEEFYKDPFKYIHHSVQEIIRNNELLTQTIGEQVLFLRTSFYQQLINGDFSSEEEIKSYANYIGFDFEGTNYATCIVRILGYGQGKAKVDSEIMQELDIRRYKVREVLLNYRFTKTYFHYIADDRILLILEMNENNFNYYREQMINYIHVVREQLLQCDGIEVQFAWGELCSQLLDLTYSIQMEQQVLDYHQINGEYVYEIYYPEFLNKQYRMYYPKEWEQKLINSSKDGNEKEVMKVLRDLQIENFIKRKLTPAMIKVFLNQLYGTLLRIIQDFSIEDEEIYEFGERLNNENDFYILYDECFSSIVKSFIHVCEMINERKKNQSARLINEVREFIQQNYKDKNLSLSVLAEKFNYSPAYLTIFLKEQMGKSFSECLEEIRMNHAVRLLLDTNLASSF